MNKKRWDKEKANRGKISMKRKKSRKEAEDNKMISMMTRKKMMKKMLDSLKMLHNTINLELYPKPRLNLLSEMPTTHSFQNC